MISPDAALDARPEACSACGGTLDALGRCAKCGAVFGEAHRCPLCQAISDVEPSPKLYYRCKACGGPRIPPNGNPISEPEIALLKSARGEQLRSTAFQAGAGFALASGVLSSLVTVVVLLATSPALFAKVAALVACLVPFVLSFFALGRGRRHARKLETQLEQAWLLAAARIVASREGQMTASALAQVLRVNEARAEFLLAEVSVQDFVASSHVPTRVRVTELADPQGLDAAAERVRAASGAGKP